MPQKMLSCICGNTELEKVGVNLLRSNDAESLELLALVCRGNGCGRVTFRPAESRSDEVRSPEFRSNDMSKTKQVTPNHDRETIQQMIAWFEQVYTERLVYKAIAERDPGCGALVEALKADRGIHERITRTFAPVYECLELNQGLMRLLQSLPSTASSQANGTSNVAAASK